MPFNTPEQKIKDDIIKALTTGKDDQELQKLPLPEELSRAFTNLLTSPAFQTTLESDSDDPAQPTPEQKALVAAYVKDAINYALAILADEDGLLVRAIKSSYRNTITKFSTKMTVEMLVTKIIEWITLSSTEATPAYHLIKQEIAALNARRTELVRTITITHQGYIGFLSRLYQAVEKCPADNKNTLKSYKKGLKDLEKFEDYDSLVNDNLNTFYQNLQNPKSELNKKTKEITEYLDTQTVIALPKKTSRWSYGLRAAAGIVGLGLLAGIILTALVATHGVALTGIPWLSAVISPIVGYVSTNLAAAIGIGVAASVVATTAITAAAEPSVFSRIGSAIKKHLNKISEPVSGSHAVTNNNQTLQDPATKPAKSILKKSSIASSAAADNEITAALHRSDSTTTIRKIINVPKANEDAQKPPAKRKVQINEKVEARIYYKELPYKDLFEDKKDDNNETPLFHNPYKKSNPL